MSTRARSPSLNARARGECRTEHAEQSSVDDAAVPTAWAWWPVASSADSRPGYRPEHSRRATRETSARAFAPHQQLERAAAFGISRHFSRQVGRHVGRADDLEPVAVVGDARDDDARGAEDRGGHG